MTATSVSSIAYRILRRPALAASVLAGCLTAFPAVADTTPISSLSPNPDGGNPENPIAVTACNGAPQTGLVYRNSESEPYIAVNPTDTRNMIAGWHQDRWSDGGGQSLGAAYSEDGGVTWQQVVIPFTRCSGGQADSAGDFERASDPWISFGPDGRAHYMALVFNDTVSENAMVSAYSDNGGKHWSEPVIITRSPAQDRVGASLFHDKNSFTADPYDPNLVYATWTVFRLGSWSILFSRSTDGGESWKHARPIQTIDPVEPAVLGYFRQGSQIVVLPDRTLVNVYYRILFDQVTRQSFLQQTLLRSRNQGRTWAQSDVVVSDLHPAGAVDPELGVPVRDAGQIPDVAVNPKNGDLYMTWQDSRFNGDQVGVVLTRSTDGGFTWSAPISVNQPDGVQAFLPSVAVNADGTVGVLYYDFRNDVPGDGVLDTDIHLALFDANLTSKIEKSVTTNSFDLRQSVITGGRGYFPGDYVGLEVDGSDFVAAVTVTNQLGLLVDFPQTIPDGLAVDTNNRQDIVFSRISP